MSGPTHAQLKELIRRQEAGWSEAERLRRKALRDMPYNWRDVDALLELGDRAGLPSRTSSGLIEMQRCFMKARQPEIRGD